MRIVVIGGSGHIGTFLIPRLVGAGHDVVNISRGQRSSYLDDPTWQQVRHVTADRAVEDRDGTFPSVSTASRRLSPSRCCRKRPGPAG
jgi:nucleoside-diphosphate-sugar epimerase